MNSVEYLQDKAFTFLPYDDKLTIKRLGRPTPLVNIDITSSSRSRTYRRRFNEKHYHTASWLCGCDKKDALFCFPCLLFGGEKSWTEKGVRDLGHLQQSVKRHEMTRKHISNSVSLALLGNNNIPDQFDNSYWMNVSRHNEQVEQNRHVLSRMIDCIRFCGSFELALRGPDERNESSIFSGLVNFSADLDNALKKHIESATVFKRTSQDIQSELLKCMFSVCREKIEAEIHQANYLAVMVDETSDLVSDFKLAIILRYINEGTPVERFWGFIHPRQHDAESLAACIQSVLDPLLKKNSRKLIAQTYDGAAVMSGQRGGVHAIIKDQHPLAHFVHCYSHQLNLIIPQAVSQNTKVRVFFSNVDDIMNFFSNSSEKIDALNEVVAKRLPEAVQTQWIFKSTAINIIYEHRNSLLEIMQEVQERFGNAKVINHASSIERTLKDESFMFWLNIFHHVMPHVDILYNKLQTKKADFVNMKSYFETFEKSIQNVIENIDKIIDKGDLLSEDLEPSRKRSRQSIDDLRAETLVVCDTIVQTAKTRFLNIDHLAIATLFKPELFAKFNDKFPDEILNTVLSVYPLFDWDRLKTELTIIYVRPEFRDIKGAVAFLNLLTTNNLEECFKETIKLLQILITIPMPTAEAERCFLTLTRVKNFLRNTMGKSRLSEFSMLSIENALIKKDPRFNEKVIEKFASTKQRQMEFMYKN